VNNKKEELMALDGVSGVSEKDGEIVVYLGEDSDEIRAAVRAIAGDAKVVVTGKFGT
jgi:phosphotransferase system IIB component